MENFVMGEARCSVVVIKTACKLQLGNNKNRDRFGNIAVNGAIGFS
jgi:hypothetical protein